MMEEKEDMITEELKEYEAIEHRRVEDLNSDGWLLLHKKSGARVLLLSNNDENKVFSIGFRTPPYDSTGLPHILEHSVLCGSRKFPAKDPFVELVKGSLNTFLNAMTYPDKTVYPVASCNEKDFQNLMNVYLDAVFYPNIYKREQIFKQEGWHYELENIEDEITINGVVYNEMKGAFSSPDDMLDREVFNTLFPDTAYSFESGGDPEVIPTLTYENFLAFHKKYYHPSNSYIYLYGDMDMAEKLTFLDQEYLSHFDAAQISSEITLQKPFTEPVKKRKQYSITNEEPETDNTYLSYNTVIATSLDKELYVAFQIIEYALLLAPGAVLKQTLLDRGLGKDIQSTYENGVYQPYFSIIAKNANADQLDAFLATIKEVLYNVCKDGLDKKALRAGINYYEFKYREADFGSYPKGLMYGLQAFDSWLYNEKEPFMHIEAIKTFTYLKEQVNNGYFEKLIEQYLLNNSHASIVVVEPERGLTARLDQALADQMREMKASMTKAELEQLINDTNALTAYQEEPSTKEELLSIPLLQISDIKKEAQPYLYTVHQLQNTTLLTHDLFTNGIGYLNLVFDTKKLPLSLIPYIGILKNVLGFVNTKNYSYADLFNEINQNSGGITMGAATYIEERDPKRYRTMFEIRAKVLYEKLPFAFEMIKEILFTSDFSDEKRLKEILSMLKSRLQTSMTSSGHSTAALRAMSYCSETAAVAEQVGGLSFYRLVESLEAHFDEKKEALIGNLTACMHAIFRKENLLVDYTAEPEEYVLLEKETKELLPLLDQTPMAERIGRLVPLKKNEGFKTASKVQYVAVAGNYMKKGLSYTGSLKVLKVILGYDYLWNQVRVKGGAYGCMNSFSRVGDAYFVSYRDPNLEKTLETYRGAVNYLKQFDVDERDMTKYIIGTISDMDIPLSPSAKGMRGLSAYLSNDTVELLQQERDEVLGTTSARIAELSEYVEEILSQNQICVLGSEEKIEAQKALFDTVENLFRE